MAQLMEQPRRTTSNGVRTESPNEDNKKKENQANRARSAIASLVAIDPQVVEKAAISSLLKETGLLRLVSDSLKNEKRLAILRAMLRYEDATENGPISFTDLLSKLEGWGSNDLAYHLKPLSQAGLIKRVTNLTPSDTPAEGPFKAFYRTTALLIHAVRPYLDIEVSE